jgi:hypothetical protein
MLGKIFLKELRGSRMFKSVDMDEKKPSLTLEIEVISLIEIARSHAGDNGIW